MPIARTGKIKVKVARTYRGLCGICHQGIWPKEAYEDCVGGTNTSNGYTVHYNCYKPTDALTWEELPEIAKQRLRER